MLHRDLLCHSSLLRPRGFPKQPCPCHSSTGCSPSQVLCGTHSQSTGQGILPHLIRGWPQPLKSLCPGPCTLGLGSEWNSEDLWTACGVILPLSGRTPDFCCAGRSALISLSNRCLVTPLVFSFFAIWMI